MAWRGVATGVTNRNRRDETNENRAVVVPPLLSLHHDPTVPHHTRWRWDGLREARVLPPLRREDVLEVRDTLGLAG